MTLSHQWGGITSLNLEHEVRQRRTATKRPVTLDDSATLPKAMHFVNVGFGAYRFSRAARLLTAVRCAQQ